MVTAARRVWFELPVFGTIALGGAVGAASRYEITQVWSRSPTGFPWAVFTINLIGCALIGVLMVLVESGSAGIGWYARSSASACSAGSRPSPRTRWTSSS